MDAGKVIYTVLNAASSWTDIMGSKLYPGGIPQKTAFPCAAYTITGDPPTPTKDGQSPLHEASVQLDIYAESMATAADAAAAAKAALNDYVGTPAGVAVDRIIYETGNLLQVEENPHLFWVTQDYEIRIKYSI